MRMARYIDPGTCTAWSRLGAGTLSVKYGWRGRYAALAMAAGQPRAPQGLVTRAVRGYRQGVLGINELASWYAQRAADLQVELGSTVTESGPEVDDDFWGADEPLLPDELRDAPS